MIRFSRSFALAAASVIAFHWAAPARAFTTAQAEAGRTAFRDTCQMCHGENLRQMPNAILAPPEFGARWTGRNTTDLLIQLRATMPPEAPGSLPETTYLSVIAYLLQANGFAANNAALTAATSAVLGSDALARAQPAAEPIGVTKAGTVRDFVPLTEQALKAPAAGDWPMLRRDYAASDFSPL
jgi:cytochrome c5